MPQIGDVFEFDFQIVNILSTRQMFGCYETSFSGRLFLSFNATTMYCNDSISGFTPDLLRHSAQIVVAGEGGRNLTIDGATYHAGAVNTIASNTCIFVSSGSLNAKMIGRFFNFSQERGGVMVHDLIPVRVGTVGYMYDRVSGQLFGNSGTGDFIVGPDKN